MALIDPLAGRKRPGCGELVTNRICLYTPLYQREEHDIDSEAICGEDQELHRRKLLGERLLCDHDWT